MTRIRVSHLLQYFQATWNPRHYRLAVHVVLVAIPVGVVVGIAVAGYDYVVNSLVWGTFSRELSIPLLCVLPVIGMLLTGFIVHYMKLPSVAMADEIVNMYHVKTTRISLRGGALPKLFASIATMGFGGSAGMEGASKWLGGMIAGSLQSLANRSKKFNAIHGATEIVMLAGAAAGIGAIFRAPLTGAIMGVESPYKKDMAHDALIHALVASATSYATFSLLRDGDAYFSTNFSYVLHVSDLWKCAFVGLGAGLLSRLFLFLLARCRRIAFLLRGQGIPLLAYGIGGVLLSLIAYLLLWSIGEPASLQAGLPVARNFLAGHYALNVCVVILIAKIFATVITFGMGGVGGLFLPSATIGAAFGACCDLTMAPSQPGLFTLVGIAAFTGASYNSLLFSAVFIAEASGNPALVVPGILASTFAYLVSMGVSNAPSQVFSREEKDGSHQKQTADQDSI